MYNVQLCRTTEYYKWNIVKNIFCQPLFTCLRFINTMPSRKKNEHFTVRLFVIQFSCIYWNPQFLFLLLLLSRSSFAGGRPLILTTKKRSWKMHFWDPSQWDKMCFNCQRIKFQWKKNDQNFHICLRSGPKGLTQPPPPRVNLTVKCYKSPIGSS